MPLSEKRLAANRANAAKSTGPVSPMGKRNSSRNGMRHGILANAILIDNESRERFAALLNSLYADFQPEGHTECLLVEKMAVAHWHLLRVWAVGSAAIVYETRRQSDSTLGNDPPTRTMLALRAIGENERHPDLTGRYEHRYDRQYYRALEALNRLQQARRQRDALSPEWNGKKEKKPFLPREATQFDENKGPAKTGEPIKTTPEPTE